MSNQAFTPSSVKAFSWIAFISCTLIVIASIAAFIVASDLTKNTKNTNCNTQNVINQAYTGSIDPTVPWSGVANFNQFIN
jgi:hypothetical protein